MSQLTKRVMKAEETAEKALYKAQEALLELYRASQEDGVPGVKGNDDNRLTLAAQNSEFARHLEMRRAARSFN